MVKRSQAISRSMRVLALLVAAWVGNARLAIAQAIPLKTLGKPLVEMEDPFSGILDLRELSSGALIVLDAKDNLIYHVGPDMSAATKISREGSGPLEYRRMMSLIRRGPDSTLAYDVLNARFLVIDRQGAPTGTISLRDAAGGMPVGPAQVRGYDREGRLYFQGIKVSMGKAGPSVSDTTYILRLDPRSKHTDTLGVARLEMPGMKMSGDMQKGTGNVALTMPAFPQVDEWALMPSGQVLLVRGANYQMELLGGTEATRRLPPVRYAPVKVTEVDKQKMREQLKQAQTEMKKAAASAASALGARGPLPGMAMMEPDEWPAVKPAFGQGALKVAPDGEIWVLLHRDAANEKPLYDVFSPDGKLKFRVELPKKASLVGFGSNAIYVARMDEDELQYLGRYPRP